MDAAGLPAGPSFEVPLEIFPAFTLYQAGQLDIEAYLDELADYLDIDAAKALKVHDSILLRPTAGTLAIVQDLNARGLVTGCLSNTNTLHWAVLTDPERFPNVSELQVKAASHDIGFNKPSEESYRAFEKLSGIDPAQILFFEDGKENVDAAKSFGWNAVLIDPAKEQAPQIRQGLTDHGV